MRTPSLSSHDRAAFLSELSLCIAEAEVSSTAQAATVTILARTGYDATEAFASLLGEMDALSALRAVRTCLSAPTDRTPAS